MLVVFNRPLAALGIKSKLSLLSLAQRVKARLIIICVLFLLPFATVQAQTMRGVASYYANEFVGQRTASGEVFTLHELTCAHRTLPFGTKLKVKNLDNGSEVVVRVNDRGPYIPGRIIDLSYAAAKELGIIIKGLCNAEISFYDEQEEAQEETRSAPLALMVDISPQDLYNDEEYPWSKFTINNAPLRY